MRTLALLLCLSLAALAQPAWYVEISQGGGITGGGHSLKVTSSGEVVSSTWSQAGDPPKQRQYPKLSPERLAKIKAALDAPKLRQLQLNQFSNMSQSLHYQEGDVHRSYTWNLGSTIPGPLQRAYNAVQSATRRK